MALQTRNSWSILRECLFLSFSSLQRVGEITVGEARCEGFSAVGF
jgi:hypothetical protein